MVSKNCKTPCKLIQICNPKTGRCVLKTGKIGKNISKSHLSLIKKSSSIKRSLIKRLSPLVNKHSSVVKKFSSTKRFVKTASIKQKKRCKSKQILNLKTNRCVKKDGKIGKLLLLSRKNKKISSSDRVIKTVSIKKLSNLTKRISPLRTSISPRLSIHKLHKRIKYNYTSPIKRTLNVFQDNTNDNSPIKRTLNVFQDNRAIKKSMSQKLSKQFKNSSPQLQKKEHKLSYESPTLNIINFTNIIKKDKNIHKKIKKYGSGLFNCLLKNANKIPDVVKHLSRRNENMIVNTDDIEVLQSLGEGSYGSAYIINIVDTPVVIKIISINKKFNSKHFNYEYHMQELFYQSKLPVPLPYFKCIFSGENKNNQYGIIAMKIDEHSLEFGMAFDILKKKQSPDTLDFIVKSINKLIKKMCDNNLVHGDFHWGNFGLSYKQRYYNSGICIKDKKFYPLLIDFGFSTTRPCEPRLTLIQLLRTLEYSDEKDDKYIHEYNKKYLKVLLIESLIKIDKTYKNIDKWDEDEIEDEWDRLSYLNRKIRNKNIKN
jgi:tRNA A-37 threonylcarbamoyl transferase component Bud32